MIDIFKKRCIKCGKSILADDSFCSRCGNPVRLLLDIEAMHFGMCPACARYNVLRAGHDIRPLRSLHCIKCGYTTRTIEVFHVPGALEAAIEIIKDGRRFAF